MFKKCLRWCALLTMVMLSAGAALAAAELAARGLYTRLAPPAGDLAVQVLLGNTRPDDAMAIRLHPYMLYQNNPRLVRYGIKQNNSMGYRGPEITPLPAPGVVRILALGGSTTYGYPLHDPADAWPAQLQRILSARICRPVEVVNGGLEYALSSDLLAHYMFQDRYIGARIVIFHEGGNDAVPLMSSAYQPDYGFFRGWASPGFGARRGERLLLRSRLVRLGYAFWLNGMDIGEFVSQPPEIAALTPQAALANVTRNQPTGFERNVDALVHNIRDDGAVPVLFPFYLAEKAAVSGLPDDDFWKTHYDALALGTEKDIDVLQDIAQKQHALYVRMAPSSIPVRNFFDQCHLRKDGETLKATFLADRLEPLVRSMEK